MSTLEYLYEKIKNILIKFTSWRTFETKAIFIARGTAQNARIQCGTRAARIGGAAEARVNSADAAPSAPL